MKKIKIIKQTTLQTEKVGDRISETYIYADRWDFFRYEGHGIEITDGNLELARTINPNYVVGNNLTLPWEGIKFYVGDELVDTVYIDHDPTFEVWEIDNGGEDKLIYSFNCA
jgi:hypothetical protein